MMYNSVMVTIEIGENERNQRLDRFLRKYLSGAPLSHIYKMIRKDVKVNGRREGKEYVLQEGDLLALYLREEDLQAYHKAPRTADVRRQFGIAYEDANILIAEKPFGLLTHGDRNEKKNHLTNQVMSYLTAKGEYKPSAAGTFTPAPVNRLDRNTTGLVIFCKTYAALKTFNQMIRERNCIGKFYVTIVRGRLTEPLHLTGRLDKDTDRNMVQVSGEGALAIETIARPLAGNDDYTLTEVQILTGRTHQIRAHLASAGYPLVGDPKYGDPALNRKLKAELRLTTQILHAYRLTFTDCPGDYAYLNGREVTAPPPAGFGKAGRALLGEEFAVWNSQWKDSKRKRK